MTVMAVAMVACWGEGGGGVVVPLFVAHFLQIRLP